MALTSEATCHEILAPFLPATTVELLCQPKMNGGVHLIGGGKQHQALHVSWRDLTSMKLEVDRIVV
jgi:hypothetical protein